MSMEVRRLGDGFAVSPQVAPEDMAALAEAGFGTVINNRPDGEEPGQPAGAAIEAAARAAGLGYLHVPVDHSGFTAEQVAAVSAAMAHAKPVFAFCRSGTRSAMLWGLAMASRGADEAETLGAAAGAGYDLRPIVPLLRQLRGVGGAAADA
jgi:uncharacterized protein (TIGR01244 family)